MSASIISELSYAVSIVKDRPDQKIGLIFASDDASSTIGEIQIDAGTITILVRKTGFK